MMAKVFQPNVFQNQAGPIGQKVFQLDAADTWSKLISQTVAATIQAKHT